MKRQKRILAGAAAMLLALGMLIGCDTPANSGSSDGGNVGGDIQNPDDSDGDEDNSDGGSVGGDITLPAGDPEAESELVGTWETTPINNSIRMFVLNTNKTCESDQGNGMWSATQDNLVIKLQLQEPHTSMKFFLSDEDKLILEDFAPNFDLEFSRKGLSSGSVEGTWEYCSNDITINFTIIKESFKMIIDLSDTMNEILTGSQMDNILTLEENMLISPYTLSPDRHTLTWFQTSYTKQQ